MYDHFDDSFGERIISPEETRLREGIFALGLQPEFLGQMDVEEARTVLTGMAKLVASMTHTDRLAGDHKVAGLDVADANALGSVFSNVGPTVLEQVIGNLTAESPLTAEQALRQELNDEYKRLEHQSRSLIEQIFRSEVPLHRFTGRLALHAPGETGGAGKPERSILELDLTEGVVNAALTYTGRGLIVPKLNKRQRAFAESQHTEGDSDKTIYISAEDAKTTGMPAGWVRFFTARSKNDSSITSQAVVLYEQKEAYDDSQLDGARLVGKFKAVVKGHNETLEPAKELAAEVTEQAWTRNYVRLPIDELVSLTLNGQIELFSSTEANVSQAYLALFRPSGRGKQEVGIIAHETTGIASEAG